VAYNGLITGLVSERAILAMATY